MNYLRQIQRGIDFVEERLTEDIALADVSRAAGVSHWHFQRMFKALTNETLKGYVRSRRLANARSELISTQASVLDIALRAGFDSHASFTRAFKKAFGITPARYRSLGDEYLYLEKVRIDEEYLRHMHEHVSLTPVYAAYELRHMVGMATQFYGVDSERNNIGEKIPPLWDEFLPRLEEVKGAIPGICYGVLRQAEPDSELLEYVAAVEVKDVPLGCPTGMVHCEIPAATYATFTHRGLADSIDRTVNYVYSNWFMQSGRRHTYGPDLEVYDSRWHPTSPDSVMEYAVPLAEP
ncbi:MAG: AraC family transcriptional regulator [Myxococcota bacterium]